MKHTREKRDFAVFQERISSENIQEMSELLALAETKRLIAFMGYHAEKAHIYLCRDIFLKNEQGYVLSDSYDLVQSVAVFLYEHCGKLLDDTFSVSKKGRKITIKFECYRIIARQICRKYRISVRCVSLENAAVKRLPERPAAVESDHTAADKLVASLNLTDNMAAALEHRVTGLSYPEIAKLLSRAVSTVYEYFTKMRARYSAIYG